MDEKSSFLLSLEDYNQHEHDAAEVVCEREFYVPKEEITWQQVLEGSISLSLEVAANRYTVQRPIANAYILFVLLELPATLELADLAESVSHLSRNIASQLSESHSISASCDPVMGCPGSRHL